jgi:hypothetical protein
MLDVAGRERLVAFLEETADRLQDLNREVEAVVMAHLGRLGVTPEMFQQAVTEVSGHPPDPPLDRRVPGTDDRIEVVEAWLVGDGSLKGLVLRDRHGLGWQLGETGLGWSFKSGPAEGWEVYADLQRQLPAAIVARPKGARPWDYKLHLSTGPLLVVMRGSDGILRFSVRTTKAAAGRQT